MEKAENIISRIFDGKADKNSSGFVKVFTHWNYILQDKRLADHCHLEDINDNSIRVSFDHPGWIQIFRMNQSSILRRLNSHYKNLHVSSVIMYLKDQKLPSQPLSRKVMEEKKEKKGEKKEFTVNLQDIRDDELKDMLQNLGDKLQKKSR